MEASGFSWERCLLTKAYEALDQRDEAITVSADPSTLKIAYEYCTEITSLHSRTFFLASGLLPAKQKKAVRALYAFCRISDDLVDESVEGRRQGLREWRQHNLSDQPPTDDLVARAWTDSRLRYRVPRRYAEQLLEGVAHDLNTSRYQTFDDLAHYCYGVASTVGLMAMHIVGFSGPEAIPYAIKLGVALQLTNILRDVAEDWAKDRIYLPLEELAAFGLSENDIASACATGNGPQLAGDMRWQAFMRFQIERARRLYAEALPGIRLLGRQGRLAVAAAAELYRAILDDIEEHNYDVFSRRAFVTGNEKVRMLPGIWWRVTTHRYDHLQIPVSTYEPVPDTLNQEFAI